jgi:DNA-binding LacI/PurR family transcriptional regulator
VRWVDQQFILRNSEGFFSSSQIVIWLLPEERKVMQMYHLQSKNVPQLMINRNFGNFNHVCTDPRQGLSEAMDIFYSGCEKQTAIISWQISPRTPYLAERLLAFYEECFCHQATIPKDWFIKIPNPARPEDFDAAAQKLFAPENFPRKLFIAEESMMPLIVMAASSYKRQLGKDYEILVFSQGNRLSEQNGLFMIHQPMTAFRRAVENFIRRTISGDRSPYQITIKSELRIPKTVLF